MNGFKSRKFLIALIGVAGGVVAAFALPALGPFAWLQEHTVTIFAAVCSLAAAYIAVNAIVDWGRKKNA